MNRRHCQDELVIHEFHFKEVEIVKAELMRIGRTLHMSLSEVVGDALKQMLPILEKSHFHGRSRQCRYQNISQFRFNTSRNYPLFNSKDEKVAQDSEEKVSIHAYLDESLYNQLSQIKHDLKIYSLAQLVRMALRMFVRLYHRCHKKKESHITVLFKLWVRWLEKKKKTHICHGFLQQLSHNAMHSRQFLFTYSWDYQLLQVECSQNGAGSIAELA